MVVLEIDWDEDPPNVEESKWTLTTGYRLDVWRFQLASLRHPLERYFERYYVIRNQFRQHILGRKTIRWVPCGFDCEGGKWASYTTAL